MLSNHLYSLIISSPRFNCHQHLHLCALPFALSIHKWGHTHTKCGVECVSTHNFFLTVEGKLLISQLSVYFLSIKSFFSVKLPSSEIFVSLIILFVLLPISKCVSWHKTVHSGSLDSVAIKEQHLVTTPLDPEHFLIHSDGQERPAPCKCCLLCVSTYDRLHFIFTLSYVTQSLRNFIWSLRLPWDYIKILHSQLEYEIHIYAHVYLYASLQKMLVHKVLGQ